MCGYGDLPHSENRVFYMSLNPSGSKNHLLLEISITESKIPILVSITYLDINISVALKCKIGKKYFSGPSGPAVRLPLPLNHQHNRNEGHNRPKDKPENQHQPAQKTGTVFTAEKTGRRGLIHTGPGSFAPGR